MKHLFTIILLFFSFGSVAQSNYKKGYVVTLQGDTLKGFINQLEWIENPKSFSFKAKLEEVKSQEFTPATSAYFEIENLDSYQRYEGRISMDRTDIANLPTHLDTAKTKADIFLKVEQKGSNVTLFSFTDQLKTRFFLQSNKEDKPKELVFRKYQNPHNNRIGTSKTYMGQIWLVAQEYNMGSADLKKKIESAEYTLPYLLPIVSRINGLGKKQANQLNNKRKNLSFFAGLGLNRTLVDVRGNHKLAEGANYNYSYTPKVSVGVEHFVNPDVKRLLLRAELSFTSAKGNLSKVERALYLTREYLQTLNQKTLSFSPQVSYNLYNKENFKFYLGGGVAGNISFYSDIIYYANTGLNADGVVTSKFRTEDNLVLNKVWSAFPIRTGVNLNKKLNISVSYFIPTPLTKYINYTFNSSAIHLDLHYLFNKIPK